MLAKQNSVYFYYDYHYYYYILQVTGALSYLAQQATMQS